MTKESSLRPSYKVNFAMLLIASLLYLLNFTTGNDSISLFVTLLLALYLFFAKKEVLLPTMIYLSFFAVTMVYGHTYLSFFIVLAFFTRVIVDGTFKAQMMVFYFIVYFLIQIISTDVGTLSIGRINEILSFFLVLPAGYAFRKCKSKDCILYFITGFFISTLFGIARFYLPRLDEVAGDTDVTPLENMSEVYRFSGISNDSNFYAILAIVTLFILFFKVSTSIQIQKSISKVITMVLLIVTFVLGLMTFSKSFVVCALFLFVVYYIGVKKCSRSYLIIVSTICIIMYFVFSSTISEIVSAYLLRFGDDSSDMDMITSNRTVIWSGYLEDISNFSFFEILFGAGMVHEGKVAAHNTYIQLFYEFGIVGFITNLLLLFKSKTVFVKEKLAKYSFVIMALLVVLFFNLSGYTFSSAWAVFTIMFISCSDNEIMI